MLRVKRHKITGKKIYIDSKNNVVKLPKGDPLKREPNQEILRMMTGKRKYPGMRNV